MTQTSNVGLVYLTKQEAESILRDRLMAAGIPLNSITARCMFEPTRDSHGRNRCKFGNTPLWGNVLRVTDDKVLRSEFMEFVQRLCDSGHAHQRAALAALGR